MPQVKDDPRQVLALLNSLGFVGITAEQLKAFMKDLKMYRKVKDRERQQWKEEMKQRILKKQQEELTTVLTDTPKQDETDDNSVVKIEIQCISESESEEETENKPPNVQVIKKPQMKQEIVNDTPVTSMKASIRSRSQSRSSTSVKTPREARISTPPRAASAPDISERVTRPSRAKSCCSEPSRTPRNPSRCSTQSQAKSFIRPWKLRPDAQKSTQSNKNDPVTLYQSYQRGWKQINFPGENRHADIRWAVREKMLGGDPTPTPRPILKKSCSTMSVRR